jgi:hypothetical protein
MFCKLRRLFLKQFLLCRAQERKIRARTYMLASISVNRPYFSTEPNANFERFGAMFRKLGRLLLKQLQSRRAQERKIRVRTYCVSSISVNRPYFSTEPNTDFERLGAMFRKLGRLFLKRFRSSRAQERKIRVRTYCVSSISANRAYFLQNRTPTLNSLAPCFANSGGCS